MPAKGTSGNAYEGRCYTLDEVARELGVTRERCRQIERVALRKVAKELRWLRIGREVLERMEQAGDHWQAQ